MLAVETAWSGIAGLFGWTPTTTERLCAMALGRLQFAV
jgi:hypothetical protein